MGNKKVGIFSLTNDHNSFDYEAYRVGMLPDDAREVLQREFKRRHNGTNVNNYWVTYLWEDLRKNKTFKKMTDQKLRMNFLPWFEQLIDPTTKPTSILKWRKEINEAYKKRLVKVYENRAKRIERTIARVLKDQLKEYKRWKEYYELILPTSREAEIGSNPDNFKPPKF